MDLRHDAEQLQRIAEFHQEKDRLRTIARASIVWGIINVLVGVSGLSASWLNIVLIVIGAFYSLQGIWFNARPSAMGVLVDAFVLLVIAAWDFFILALQLLAGFPPSPIAAIFGLICFGLALYRLLSFSRLYQLFQEPIAAEDLQHMDELIRYLSTTKSREANDIISLQMKQKQWRAYLGPHYALFLDVAGKKVIVAEHSELSIEERGKVLLGSTLKVRLQIREKRWDGLISPTALTKLRAWKLSEVLDAEPEVQPSSPTDAITRRDHIQ